MRQQIIRAVPVAILAAAALSFAACGGSGSSATTGDTTEPAAGTTQTTSTETTATTATTRDTKLTVTMTEFAFTPKDVTAPAGTITITAPNKGKVTHELVLIRTDLATDALPLTSTDVNEDAFTASALPGEIPDVAAGQTKSVTVTLPPGRYVMLCNVEGHYKSGMVGTLTVR